MTPQLILGVVFLMLTIAPVIYFGKIAKNRSLRAKTSLTNLAKGQSVSLDEMEHWNDKCIGVSREMRKLLFVNLDIRNNQVRNIDLSNYRRCTTSVKKTTIELILEPKKTSGENFAHLELYNESFDSRHETGFHHQLAIKWAKTVQQVLDKKPTPMRKSA